jgi:uncharacterized repeat protein (TIGR01451 family)
LSNFLHGAIISCNGERGEGEEMRKLAALAVVVGVGVVATAGLARADVVPTTDLAVVSLTADVSHAKIGDQITFTIVAANRGPDVADLFVVEHPPDAFDFVLHVCDRGISPDGPFCEYSSVQPGETVTTRFTVSVLPTSLKRLTHTVCVTSSEAINDTDPSNDCASIVEKIVGKRPHS